MIQWKQKRNKVKNVSYNWTKWNRGGEWVDNDEGYNYQRCAICGRTTEHELDECLSCFERVNSRRSRGIIKKNKR